MDSIQDMYVTFLRGIGKNKVAIVSIPKWNEFINAIMLDWVNERIAMKQYKGTISPDLEFLRVDTDGVDFSPIPAKSIGGGNEYLFKIPFNTSEYPEYYYFVGVQFSQVTTDNLFRWIPARLMTPAQRGFILANSYERPKDDRLYYEFLEEYIRLLSGKVSGTSNVNKWAMRLEYYSKPMRMELDTHGNRLSDDFRMTAKTRKEITDMATRVYLEEKANPRYQSYLNETMIKERTKT